MSFKEQNHTEELVLAFQRGEEKGYDFIFRQYFTSLCFFATRILKDENNAKDIVQDCFVKLWSNHTILYKPAAIKSFLYTVVRNACLHFIRNKKQTDKNEKELQYFSETTNDNWLDQVTYSEMIKEIYDHILTLPPKMQEVFRKHYIDEKSCIEIASDLHTLPDTVRQQRARALVLLREKLGLTSGTILFFL